MKGLLLLSALLLSQFSYALDFNLIKGGRYEGLTPAGHDCIVEVVNTHSREYPSLGFKYINPDLSLTEYMGASGRDIVSEGHDKVHFKSSFKGITTNMKVSYDEDGYITKFKAGEGLLVMLNYTMVCEDLRWVSK